MQDVSKKAAGKDKESSFYCIISTKKKLYIAPDYFKSAII